jgi:peptidyl-prolyl cis-trans isomerase SurA
MNIAIAALRMLRSAGLHLLTMTLAAAPVALLIAAGPTPVGATTIAVLVNDDPITEYDIAQRSRLITVTSGGQGGGDLRQRATDELIEERLKMQEARRLGVIVASAEVDDAYGSIATRVKLSPSQFSQALEQMGVNPATLKKRLEADLSWRDVVRARFSSSVRIRDRDIEAAMSRKGEEMPTTTEELALQQIIFIIPSGSSAAFINQRKQDSQRFKSQFNGCDGARELAKSFRDIVVRDTVRRNTSELSPLVVDSLKNVPINGLSPPNQTASAIEFLAVCERTVVDDDSAARKQVQSELMNEQGDRLSHRLLIDLKQSAVVEYR